HAGGGGQKATAESFNPGEGHPRQTAARVPGYRSSGPSPHPSPRSASRRGAREPTERVAARSPHAEEPRVKRGEGADPARRARNDSPLTHASAARALAPLAGRGRKTRPTISIRVRGTRRKRPLTFHANRS